MINTSFLQDVARYVDGRVAKVVLNGTYVIDQFEVKQVTDNVLAMKYLIPAADVPLVTSIELRDAADNVISVNNVHIPITADHVMIQSIAVKEGA